MTPSIICNIPVDFRAKKNGPLARVQNRQFSISGVDTIDTAIFDLNIVRPIDS
jgi:hypothetical protein